MDRQTEARIRQQVTEFVGDLRRKNQQSQRRGAPRIPESEYQKLTDDLMAEVVKRTDREARATTPRP